MTTHSALRSGLLAWRGEYVTSTDAAGRNAGRPVRCYWLTNSERTER